MVDLILHIGFGKCGSTALQYALSNTPTLKVNKRKYKDIKYLSIDIDGNVYAESSLSTRARLTASHSVSSLAAVHFEKFSDETFNAIRQRLEKLSNNNESLLVLSCESWIRRADVFAKLSIFEKLGIRPKVIAYVRNPVEWINSAWWQWGAWSDKTLKNYIDEMLNTRILKWHTDVEKWKDLLGTENVEVKVLPKDIVKDFYQTVGVDMNLYKENRGNSSLPKEILRYYQKHRELRKSEHDNALDFLLSRHLKFHNSFSKTPWVLDPTMITHILTQSKENNLRLMELLDGDSKKICAEDRRWWDLSAFKDKIVSSPECKDECLTYEELDRLLMATIRGMEKLNAINLKFRQTIIDLKP